MTGIESNYGEALKISFEYTEALQRATPKSSSYIFASVSGPPASAMVRQQPWACTERSHTHSQERMISKDMSTCGSSVGFGMRHAFV